MESYTIVEDYMRPLVFIIILVIGISSCSKEDIQTSEEFKLDITYSIDD